MPASDETPEELWSKTRKGATAGRGFHFQDTVGAWFATHLLSDSHRGPIIPEGLEDLQLASATPTYVQVKSRQEQRGDYSVGDVIGFLAAMWGARQRRVSANAPDGPLQLIVERPIAGDSFDRETTLLSSLPDDHPIARAVAREFGDSAADISDRTSIRVLPWDEARTLALQTIERVADTTPAVASLIVERIRSAIAAASDANGRSQLEIPHGLERTDVWAIVDAVKEVVDPRTIQEAIQLGICSLVDFAALPAEGYFDGVSAEPGHISAGFPAPRAELAGKVVEAIDSSTVSLLTGPSGVGKSTVLWSAAYSRRDLLWYRVHDLTLDAVPLLIRLAEEMGADEASKVGFIVDGLNGVDGNAWDAFERRVASHPGIALIASARTEDLFGLTSLAEVEIIPVELDERTAIRIFTELQRRGRTAAAHWRESFEKANGLTMEYTYLLTRGSRLRDVLESQVQRRVAEGRNAELAILELVTTAHAWGAAVPLDALQRAGLTRAEIRLALPTLRDEHLIRGDGVLLTGLHQLRSTMLSRAVHDYPPPVIAQTAATLIAVLPPESIPAIMTGALRDDPTLLEPVFAALAERLRSEPTAVLLGFALRAALYAELQSRAAVLVEIAQENNVPPALQATAIQLSMIEVEDSLVQSFKEPIRLSHPILRAELLQPFQLPDRVLDALGPSQVAALLAEIESGTDLRFIIDALRGVEASMVEEIAFAIPTETDNPLARKLADLSPDSLGDILLSAAEAGAPLAYALQELAGGEDRVLELMALVDVSVVESSVKEQGGEFVVHIRALCSDDVDIDAKAIELAKRALSYLPGCTRADVDVLLAGSRRLVVGDRSFGHSALLRRYLYSDAAIDLNRRAIAFAVVLTAAESITERLAGAAEMLVDLNEYLEALTRAWMLGTTASRELARLDNLQERLSAAAASLRPSIAADPSSPGQPDAFTNDPLNSLISGVVDNLTPRLSDATQFASLAAFVGDQLLKAADESLEEQWELLPEGRPQALSEVRAKLSDLRCVLWEVSVGGTPVADIRRALRSGARQGAIARTGDVCRRSARARWDAERRSSTYLLRTAGPRAHWLSRDASNSSMWPPYEGLLLVECDSLAEWIELYAVLAEQLPTISRGFVKLSWPTDVVVIRPTRYG